MRMSSIFPTPIVVKNYAGISLSPEREAAVEHAVNNHDALVTTVTELLAAQTYKRRKDARRAAFEALDRMNKVL